ncbi:MAG: hypothetical protein FJ255_07530 [Phycisphaerae bacterium]|nr:hypothetical protein [Phycisphaerae bacterium]
MSTPIQAKICSRCGEDCSNKPRQKDRQGRYVCADCASTRAPQPPPDGTIPLADDAGPIGVAPYDPSPAPIPGVAAPGIEARLGSSGCPSCGYDLRGLKKARCPECGMLLTRGEVRRVREEQDSRRVARRAYLRPAVIAGACMLPLAVLLGFSAGVDGLLAVAAGVGGGTLAAGVIYVFCGLVFLGFDPPLRLVAVQLAAVVSGTLLTLVLLVGGLALVGGMPTTLLRFGVPALVCVVLVHSELDLELQDAGILGIPTALAVLVVWTIVAHNLL